MGHTSLIFLFVIFLSHIVFATDSCEKKLTLLKIEPELSSLSKINFYTKKFIAQNPSCESKLIEVARKLRGQFSDKVTTEKLSKSNGNEPTEETLGFKKKRPRDLRIFTQ